MECFKHCLMGHTSRSLEDRIAKSDLNCQRYTQEVSEKNFNMLPRDRSCDILVKKVAAFCPCLMSLSKAKGKSFRLISLPDEISKQPSLDYVFWIFVVTLMKNYNEK